MNPNTGFFGDNLSRSYQWTFDFSHPPEKVWPLIADTDRMNRAVGLPAIPYTESPNPLGGSDRFGEFRVLGLLLRWREHPYEWISPEAMRVDRDYLSGPLKRMNTSWQLSPIENGTRLITTVSFQPSTWIHALIAKVEIGINTRNRFRKVFEQIEKNLSMPEFPAYPPLKEDRPLSESAVQSLGARLEGMGVSERLAKKLAKFLLTSPPIDVDQLRPFRVAKVLGEEKLEVLYAFLHGAKEGVFIVSWDLLCPSCRGPKVSSTKLSGLENQGHCASCNITFDATFDQSVELTFTLHPSVREIFVGRYCIGGPMNTPHYHFQIRVPPKSSREISIKVESGKYNLRSLQSKTRYAIDVKAEGLSEIVTPFGDSENQSEITLKSSDCCLKLVNETNRELTIILERASWLEDVCTAAFVTSLQEFRTLFSSEVLRPGQEISVQAITLMFTDLKGSTQMYQRIGDARAFNLVRDHFDVLIDCVKNNEGGLVKTIGDAVMAAFTKPENALKAALAIHSRIDKENQRDRNEKLTVRIGLHTGPCYAVNLNERLDYFGSSVNIAARIEGQCEGGDVVISENVFNTSSVQSYLKEIRKPLIRFKRNLKGLEGEYTLYRINCLESKDDSSSNEQKSNT